jgi:hypothetical protein
VLRQMLLAGSSCMAVTEAGAVRGVVTQQLLGKHCQHTASLAMQAMTKGSESQYEREGTLIHQTNFKHLRVSDLNPEPLSGYGSGTQTSTRDEVICHRQLYLLSLESF